MKLRNKKILLGVLGISALVLPATAAAIVATSCNANDSKPSADERPPLDDLVGATQINQQPFLNLMSKTVGPNQDITIGELSNYVTTNIDSLRTLFKDNAQQIFINPTKALIASFKRMNITVEPIDDSTATLKLNGIFVVNPDLTYNDAGSLEIKMTNFAHGITTLNNQKLIETVFGFIQGSKSNIESVLHELSTKVVSIKQKIAQDYNTLFTGTYPAMGNDILKNATLSFSKNPDNQAQLQIKLANVKALDGTNTILDKEFVVNASLPEHDATTVNQQALDGILNYILGPKNQLTVEEAKNKLLSNNSALLKDAMVGDFSTLFQNPAITKYDMNSVTINVEIRNTNQVVIILNGFNYFDANGKLITNQPFEIVTSGYTKTTVFNESTFKNYVTKTLLSNPSLNAYQLQQAITAKEAQLKTELENRPKIYFQNEPDTLVSSIQNGTAKISFELQPNNKLVFKLTNAPKFSNGIFEQQGTYTATFTNLVANPTTVSSIDMLSQIIATNLSLDASSTITSVVNSFPSKQTEIKAGIVASADRIFSNIPSTFLQSLQNTTLTATAITDRAMDLVFSGLDYFEPDGDYVTNTSFKVTIGINSLTTRYLEVDPTVLDTIKQAQDKISAMTNFNQELNVHNEIKTLLNNNPWFANNNITIDYVSMNQAFNNSTNEQLSLNVDLKVPGGIKLILPQGFADANITMDSNEINTPFINTGIVKPVVKPDSDFQAPFPAPTKLSQLQKLDYRSIAKMSVYNGRKLGFTTYAKNQKKEGLCWSFAAMGSAECSGLRQGLLTSYQPEFSVKNFDYTSKVYNAGLDILGLNPGQDFQIGPFGSGWYYNWGSPAIGETRGLGPCWYSFDNVDGWKSYRKPALLLENFYGIDVNNVPIDQKINAMKLALAKFGAIDIGVHTISGYLNQQYVKWQTTGISHEVTVVGWDDTIPANKFWPEPASRPGAWLIKNSWGPGYPKASSGFFWLSYDSTIGSATCYDYAPVDTWDNNYYYDATVLNQPSSTARVGDRTSNIFQVKKASSTIQENLIGTNIITDGDETDVVVRVYLDNKANFNNISDPTNDPESGKLVAIKRATLKRSGAHTVYFDSPIPLTVGGNYSIVVEPQRTTTNNYMGTSGTETSTNDMSFGHFGNSGWTNIKTKNNLVARIKGLTKETNVTGVASKEAVITPKATPKQVNLYDSLTNTWNIKQEVHKSDELRLFYDLTKA